MSHKVKTHRWKSGRLITSVYYFDDEVSAKTFSTSTVDAHTVKIFNDDDELIDSWTFQWESDISYNYSDDDYSGADDDYSGANSTYA